MFILKLGAEALSLKTECLDHKFRENFTISNSDASSTSSTFSDSNGRMLEHLLNGCLVESALLTNNSQIKRCKSVNISSKSALHNCTIEPHRPRSDTIPQCIFLPQNKLQTFNNAMRKRKLNSTEVPVLNKSILFESLSRQSHSNKKALMTPLVNGASDIIGASHQQKLEHLDPVKVAISEPLSTYSTLSKDKMKQLREQINVLLKKIMHIIKSFSNYSSLSESRKFSFVSNLWYKVIVFAILQMDTESCRFMFRWLSLSIFNGKDESECSKKDKILLLEKLQEYVTLYCWLKKNSELLHCILFWFFSKYGYPDVFFMSQRAVMCKLNDLITEKTQLDSVLKLIQDLCELKEAHIQQLFCQHLPTSSSMAEFLIQWT